jgi:hypothetical protein
VAAPDYPWGMSEERFSEEFQRQQQIWGVAEHEAELTRLVFGPAWGERLGEDPAFIRWLAKILRYAAAPGDEAIFDRVWFETDARSALPLIQGTHGDPVQGRLGTQSDRGGGMGRPSDPRYAARETRRR